MNTNKIGSFKLALRVVGVVLKVIAWPLAIVLLLAALYVYPLSKTLAAIYSIIAVAWIVFAAIHNRKRKSERKSRVGN